MSWSVRFIGTFWLNDLSQKQEFIYLKYHYTDITDLINIAGQLHYYHNEAKQHKAKQDQEKQAVTPT